ncbi:class I SAM-dependent methyltransferase [Halorussus litoreus]|uniref:class I SAM-dependent methyltransferase n=1 Tax=Halorussus litoreus TaxID=1710536 RepID=UPI000E23A3C9|nr:class I SAM-dependent methyltransferase [Halorussus litoreus]
MNENLYAEYPEVYDALYADKDYEAEVQFVVSRFEEATGREIDPPEGAHENPNPNANASANENVNANDNPTTDSDAPSALIVGCGTGEHATRLRERGFEVVGVDKYRAMVERARGKSDAEFRVGALPDLPDLSAFTADGSFDLVWLPFTVIQHLRPDQIADSFHALGDRLADGGVLVFDQIASDGGHDPHLWTYPTEEGTYARLTQIHEVGDAEHRYDALVFTPDGEFFADTHLLTDYEPEYLAGVCDALGLSVELHGWYDPDAESGADGHVVFVAS